MGNSVQSSSGGSGCRHGAGGGEGGHLGQMQRRRSEEVETMEDQEAPSVVKVKMVLTKGELGWLLARLKAGDRRLEDVLQEMVARKKREGWRPSLESIVECPAEEGASSDSCSD